ncbi:hypothetical protein G3O06_20885 [Burkholderia sp. Ac-20345]|uniref:hypothetical protein n=1 Tax=Burkholderia sp. Ac-20345 TaxID=2703891 RepID=UPI00197B48D7|nr:hypothetical protein [Burkholderia sp. Ac-20345]MBN3779993.1 hypothetical protein [Burkholderia sp. Ac-20345]
MNFNKMKIKTGLFGVLLAISTATAYGLGVQSIPTEPAASAPTANPVISLTPAQVTQRARAYFAQHGLDPDSENGQIMTVWFTKVVQDPGYLDRLSNLRDQLASGAGTMLPATDRLKFLRLLKDISSESQNGCEALKLAKSGELVALAKMSSPKTLRKMAELVDIGAAKREASSEDEHYTIAELLDVEARLNTIDSQPELFKQSKANSCGSVGILYDIFGTLPEPERHRATYDFFKMMTGGKSASEIVLADPFAYLDEVFDDRRLPDAIRGRLPADGSRPLPYARLIVDGEWVNKMTPEDSGPFVDTFVNRHNNGVVVDLLTPKGVSGTSRWVAFDMSYGIADLMTQNVNGRLYATMLGTQTKTSTIELANEPMAEGKHVEIALPQPSSHGQLTRRCEIGKTEPASAIFDTLTGNAINLDCSEVRKDGKTVRARSVWLADYGIELYKSFDDEDGRTDVIIKNITIVKQ